MSIYIGGFKPYKRSPRDRQEGDQNMKKNDGSIDKRTIIDQRKLGETKMMKCGELATIIKYNLYNDIEIQFESTNEIIRTTYRNFEKGTIKSHFVPTVFGVGITGLENIKDENGKILKSYGCWHGMLQRCYSIKQQKRIPTYIGCSVSKDWLVYNNFKKWYDENYYEIEGQRTELDKDILIKGNKIYSPQTCALVPHNINILFIKGDKARGDFPIGVKFHKVNKNYVSICSDRNGIQKSLGSFKNPKEAFIAYKTFKEYIIKEIANTYKGSIPTNLYNSMLNYVVEITD